MAITITPKHRDNPPDRSGSSYIRIAGQLRADLRVIASWSGRTQQNVGEELLRQAIDEVLAQITDPSTPASRVRGVTNIRRRK